MLFTPKKNVKPPMESIFFRKKLTITNLEIKIQEAEQRTSYLDKSIIEKIVKIKEIRAKPEYNELSSKFNDLETAKMNAEQALKQARTEQKTNRDALTTATEKYDDYITMRELVCAGVAASGLVIALGAAARVIRIAGSVLMIAGIVYEVWSKYTQYQQIQVIKQRIEESKQEVSGLKQSFNTSESKYNEAKENHNEVQTLNDFERDMKEANDDCTKNNQEKTTLQANIGKWKLQLTGLKEDYDKNKPQIIPQPHTEIIISPKFS